MKTLITFLTLGLALYAQALFSETVYKGKDAEGNVLFSDQPVPNGEKIEVTPAQTYSAPDVSAPQTNEQQGPQEVTEYKISIMQPQNEATMTNDIFVIPVSLSVEPALQPGDKIRLMLNGKQYGPLYDSLSMTLNDLFRGSYQLVAEVVSEADPSKIKGQSQGIIFFQKRPGIN